jgi:hypothetical protein
MADERTCEQPLIETGPDQNNYDLPSNEPVPAPDDPGGAHAKGYSADPKPGEQARNQDPLPLAEGPDEHPAAHPPEGDPRFRPTGRSEPGDYTPNKRVMGSGR